MKAQLKFKNKVYEDYLIDENGIIYDLNGNIQPILNYNKRPHFKGKPLHSLVAHSIFGYKEGYDVHHKNFDRFDNRCCNLVYLSRSEHTSLHMSGNPSPNKGKHAWNKGQKMSEETRERMSCAKKGKKLNLTEEGRKRRSDTKKGNTNARGRIWVNNGVVNKMVYPDQILEGFVKGRIFLEKYK